MSIDSITDFLDCKFIKFLPIHDERGYFYESFNDKILDIVGFYPKQESISKSKRSVIRGLHMQNNPPVSKLVRVLQGEINDAVVDCRKDSPGFGNHAMIKLSADNPGWFFIPGGYAHGFEVISDFAIVNYLVSDKYCPNSEVTIFPFDPDIDIKWQTSRKNAIMSSRDMNAGLMRDLIK